MLYTDPRLVALYDALNPAGPDTAFYLQLAQGAARIADLGCGTGLLACALAQQGHRVTGIDPSREMLRVARKRADGDEVTWIEGDARALAFAGPMDLVLMTSHVAQVFLDDDVLLDTLRAARYALRNGGRIAFDSRDPAARAWERWTKTESVRRIEVAGVGGVEVWQERIDAPDPRDALSDGRVRFNTHYRFESTGETLVAASELRFRDQDELSDLLTKAGFGAVQWFGDWDGSGVSAASRELIAVTS
ncbi:MULTISPECIES: class I SAM-dependent methyltransferase [unclassified Caballeronia]|uniref:class I SAM-dependent methyltransferase n=1 Tax=unclassified Caballeronia TaxID=2646786 RepID=UPI002863AC05|nr:MULTISPECIES: class I SAM-dependent methyltransferase [unclassified Caballeronia]MDR5749997.1 class I SAM-dependent methyltransferase [Caballeronia sp. LZ024]MDR5842875.1 class I SAM-dependent methyltransferase [Caballeronia sp. LZ031]